MIFVKRPSSWSNILAFIFIAIALVVVFRVYGAEKFSWYSVIMSALAFVHLPRMIIDNFYIPKVGRLIVDDLGIRLDAGRYSWSYDWSGLDCAYVQSSWLGQSLILNSLNKTERVLPELKYWFADQGESESLVDVLGQHIPVKPYDEISNNQQTLGQDLGPVATKVAVVLAVTLVLFILVGAYVHRYYVLGDGTPMFMWVAGGLLTGGATLFYLFNNYVGRSVSVLVGVLGFVCGAYSVPVIVKSSVGLSNEIETHEFKLIEKSGGYQHWRSQSDGSIEIELGSVANSIHTENEQGALLALELVNGRFMTLLLPGELEKTRYRVK